MSVTNGDYAWSFRFVSYLNDRIEDSYPHSRGLT